MVIQKSVASSSKPSKKRETSKSKELQAVTETVVDAEKEKQKVIRKTLDDFNKILKFKTFLSSAYEPEITDCEVIVCFADLRGFTSFCQSLQAEMQDRKIQNFLRTYFRIYAEGLLQFIENTKIKDDVDSNLVLSHMIPSMYKNLGDGMMIVWEIPRDLDLKIQGRIPQYILPYVFTVIQRFNKHFRKLDGLKTDSYSKKVESLKLGFGIAKGHAWKLNFGTSIDYAGSVVNLASRLQDFARPEGIVCQSDFSTWILEKLVDKGQGKIGKLTKLKGYNQPVDVWLSDEVDVEQPGIEILKTPPIPRENQSDDV